MTFVRETGVDVLAPAVGNMHGLLKSMTTGGADAEHKHLDIARIAAIKAAITALPPNVAGGGKFMTLHGGSGTEDADFTAAALAGMTIIHVSSELRLAWRRGVEEGLKLRVHLHYDLYRRARSARVVVIHNADALHVADVHAGGGSDVRA